MKILKNIIFRNFSFLTLVHGANLLAPLVIIPYLIKVLGLSIYGEIILSQSIMFYPAMLVGFGFNLIGTKEVSKYKQNIELRSSVLNSIFTSKLLLLALVSILFGILIMLVPFANYRFKLLLICAFWVVIQEATFTDWYFQGVERMQTIAFSNFVSKVFAISYILIFVKSPHDYFHVPIGFLAGVILSSAFTFYLIYVIDKNNFYFAKSEKVFIIIRDSFPIFLSKFSQLYIRFNKVLIGWFLSVDAVALFDTGEKLVNILKLPVTLFGQALFPNFVQKQNVTSLKNQLAVFLLIHSLFFALATIFQKELFALFGINNGNQSFFVRLLLTLFPIALNVFLGNTFLFGLGYSKKYATTLLVAGLTYLLGVLFLLATDLWSLGSISTLIVISEMSCSLLTIHYYLKLNVKS